jgi:uncharacterized DUF497 family protein
MFIVGTINTMPVTFAPAKSERNVAERGIPFSLANDFDWRAALVAEDARCDYGERRFQAVGFIGDRLHVLVFTPRDQDVHVISLRRANDRERNRYAAQAKP